MEFFKPGRYFNFMSQSKVWLLVSAGMCAACLALVLIKGLNFGTDFRGGTEVEIAFKQHVSAGDIRSAVEQAGFAKPDVVHVDDKDNPSRYIVRVQDVSALDDELRIRVGEALCYSDTAQLPEARCPKDKQPTEIKFSPGGDKLSLRYDNEPDLAGITAAIQGIGDQRVTLRAGENNPQIVSPRDHKVEVQLKSKGDQLMDELRKALGVETVPDDPLRIEWVGPKAGKLLRDAAFKSVGIALVFMMLYVAFRFDMRFAPGAIVALLHDVVIVLGIFVITKREFTLVTVAALLTIVGYSINDTVVVFDRIRENFGKHRGKTFPDIINMSISEVLSRTILTSTTTALSLGSFLVFGSGAIKDFAFAMFLGIVVGTYSSIYIASPLTEIIDRRFFGAKPNASKARHRKREEAPV